MKTRPQALVADLANALNAGLALRVRLSDGRGAPSMVGARSRRPRLALAALLVVAFVAGTYLCFFAAPAFAGTASDRPLLFTFDGSDTSAGTFSNLRPLEVDQSDGTVYVIDQGKNVVDKFNADGQAQNFSSTGTSSLSASGTPLGSFNFNSLSDVAVDNYGANPGRLYLMREYGPVSAFSPAGDYLWQLGGFQDICGLAADTQGDIWIGDYSNIRAREYSSTGSPPAEISSFAVTAGRPCRLDADAAGNVYINRYFGVVDKYVGGVFSATIDSTTSQGVTVDQSSPSGHVFTLHGTNFNEYDASGALVGAFSGGGAIGNAVGIAYNSSLDRVYVSDNASKTVKVFGPAVSGTVPDVTIDPVSSIGISTAHFSGTVNPQGVNNSYYFEWKQGTGSSWSGASASPAQGLPVDSSDHPVAFDATGLSGNRTYQARLVGVNTDNGLLAVSSPVTFTTLAAPAPTVAIDPPSSVTATTAHLSGTINPQGDTATWRFQFSSNDSCASGAGFTNRPVQTLPASATAVPVADDLTNLLPSQHYCVRLRATNSGGTVTSAIEEFTTDPIPPDQVQTVPAAPRTDTTARLNGRVNPEGSATTYHFEYSEDGSNWTVLPDHDAGAGRTQIVVAEELTGLEPGTTYHFRFFAENAAGPATPQGQELTFTTRTTEEMTLPDRGYELVNSPDKGNQNASAYAMREDGERVLWTVPGGAPDGPNAVGNAFLAQRTDDGWRSRSLIPPVGQQLGGGDFNYFLAGMSPDFSWFTYAAWQGGGFGAIGQVSLLRLDDDQHQEVLKTADSINYWSLDMSDDGSHVLQIDTASRQLEDVGGPTPELVSVMPDGTPSECGLNLEGQSFTGIGIDAAAMHWRPGYHRMATTDASRVYFEVDANGSCNRVYGLYVRNRDTDQTTLIDPGAFGQDVEIIRATPDGRSAYFATYSQLDPADANEHGDVYRWDEEAGASTCLTCVLPDVAIRHYNTGLSEIRVSDDFSHIYFESTSQLVEGSGKAGDVNLYVLSNGTVRFVADTNDNEGALDGSELSSDGNVLLLDAKPNPSLTADAVASQCLLPSGETAFTSCRELYRYDDRDGSLECLSCRRGGTTTYNFGSRGAGDFQVSSDGNTVAFATTETLTRLDVNQDSDIYEWHNGAFRLITDGLSTYGQGFAAPQVRAVEADGRDILFEMSWPGLTGFEQDGLASVYDARIGGGFPRPNPPASCTGDACQGPLQPPPTGDSPGSATFSGPGNPPASFRRGCSRPRRRVRRAKRRLRRADTRRERHVARTKLRRAKRRLRICLGGSR